MGGYNSGRPRSRAHLSQLKKLPLSAFGQRSLSRGVNGQGYFRWADGTEIACRKYEASIELEYRVNGERVIQRIDLEYLPRHFGGELVVALCPACRRRCRVLYFRWHRFVCRRCTRAIYACQSQDTATRLQVQFQKLRERVRSGTQDRELDYFPRRPKHMRRNTYHRLRDRAWQKLETRDSALDAGLMRTLARIAPDVLKGLLGD